MIRLTVIIACARRMVGGRLEQVMGIEPTRSAWEAEVLPLNYTCGWLSTELVIIILSKMPVLVNTHKKF